jgi:polyhydroxybutyrate depolymerase
MGRIRSLIVVGTVVALMAGACGGGDAVTTTQATTEQTAAATTTTVASTTTTAAPLADADPCVTPGREQIETVTVQFDGLEREYDIVAPDGAGPFPVVLAFHGYAQSSQLHEEMTRLGDEALQRGFIAVFPEGTIPPDGSQTYFNIETIDDESLPDDVGFATAILDEVESEHCVDRGRVYASGWSNGGSLSSLLACEVGDRLAAVAGVSGVILPEDCANSVPIVILHGMADSIVPFDGAEEGDLAATLAGFDASPTQLELFTPLLNPAEYIELWVEHNGCDPEPESVEVEPGLTVTDYQGCEADVETVLQEGGDHRWIEYPTEYVLDFFFEHKL